MTDIATPVLSAYDLYETDTKVEKEGAWVDIGSMRFKLARAGGMNDSFQKEVSNKFKPYQAALTAGKMPPELALSLVANVFAFTIVQDWENVYGRDKQLIPFSKEACEKLLKDLPNLFMELQAAAQNMSNFKKEDIEAAAGN